MMVTSGIRNMIREGKTYHLPNAIDTGKDVGLQSMEENIAKRYKAGMIDLQDAITRVPRVDYFLKLTGAEV